MFSPYFPSPYLPIEISGAGGPGVYPTPYQNRMSPYWGDRSYPPVMYKGMGRLGRLGWYQNRLEGLGSVRGLGDDLNLFPAAGFDAQGNAIDQFGNLIVSDTSQIGVQCVNGTCTDLETGDIFSDPTPVAIGIGLGVGAMVHPLVGALAGAMYWYTQGRYKTQPKPTIQGG